MKNINTNSKSPDPEKLSILFRFAELGKLSSGLIHDLINPLCAMSLYLDDLVTKSNYRIPIELRKKMETVSFASKKMEAFVTSIRKKISQETDKKNFSVKHEIDHTIELISKRLILENIDIISKTSHDLYLYGNPLCFYQVLLNLLNNAIDAYKNITKNRKRNIDISVRSYNSQENSKYMELIVKDYAEGMDTDTVAKIFDPFFTTKNHSSGSGIGLYTTKSIIENDFNGKISVNTILGKGTKFTVTIPVIEYS
jgi:signal transduction histidine kinase